MLASGYRLGVDFGTSHTAAALAWPDGPVRPLLFDGSPLLPSGVFADPAAGLLTGRDALLAARAGPERFEPYPKQRTDDGTVLLGGADVPVGDLIAAVLRRVALEAARVAGGPLAQTVLTHPAGWGATRREILRAAAASVFGTPVLVAEPLAAATYFVQAGGGRVPVGGHAVVYDLGAGTFDASVVRRTSTGFEVLAEGGLTDAGGLDVDAAIVDRLGQVYAHRDGTRWARLTHPTTADDQRLRRAFWDDVRAAKEMLSRVPAATLHVPLFDDEVPLGREMLDEVARPILDRTVEVTRAVIRAAGTRPTELAGLFLVGGSSRLPLAATLLHRAFGVPPTVTDQPELVVAEGALSAIPAPPTPPPAVPPPAGEPASDSPRAGRRWASFAAGFAAVVVAAGAGAAYAAWPRDDGRPSGGATATSSPSATPPGPPPSPSATPTPQSPAACLVGTWRQTLNEATWPIQGRNVRVVSSGTINTFGPDGVARVEYAAPRASPVSAWPAANATRSRPSA